MYIIDFCKRMFQKNNLMVVAYILVNILVGALLLTGLSYVFVFVYAKAVPVFT